VRGHGCAQATALLGRIHGHDQEQSGLGMPVPVFAQADGHQAKVVNACIATRTSTVLHQRTVGPWARVPPPGGACVRKADNEARACVPTVGRMSTLEKCVQARCGWMCARTPSSPFGVQRVCGRRMHCVFVKNATMHPTPHGGRDASAVVCTGFSSCCRRPMVSFQTQAVMLLYGYRASLRTPCGALHA